MRLEKNLEKQVKVYSSNAAEKSRLTIGNFEDFWLLAEKSKTDPTSLKDMLLNFGEEVETL